MADALARPACSRFQDSITGGNGRSGSLGFQRGSTCDMASWTAQRAKVRARSAVLIVETSLSRYTQMPGNGHEL